MRISDKIEEFKKLHIEKKTIINCLIIGLVVSVGLNISINNQTGMTEEEATIPMMLIRNVVLGLSSNRMGLLLCLLGVFIIALIAETLLSNNKVKKAGVLRVIAWFFALAQVVSAAYKSSNGGSITFLWMDGSVVLRSFLLLLSYMLMAYYVMVIASWFFIGGDGDVYLGNQETDSDFSTGSHETDDNIPGNNKWKLSFNLKDFSKIILAWLPYYLIYYPGTANEDSIIQIMEFFHVRSYINDLSAVQGANIFITDHHPYILTMIFGAFSKLGLALGNITIGFAIYIVIHFVFQAAVFTIVLGYLRRIGWGEKAIKAARMVIMFVPIYPLYAICMLKDNIYSAFVLLVAIGLIEIIRSAGEVLNQKKFLLYMFMVTSCMMLTKVYGKYVMAVLAVVSIIWYRKWWKEIAISFILPVLVFHFLYQGMFLPVMNVAPGGLQEAMSVPFQQTARYMKEYGEEVTDEEYKAINAILPAKKLAKLYEPELSNRVKERYNQQATKKELKNYMKAWWNMGLKHPICYIDATLNNIYDYYDINRTTYVSYTKINTYLQDNVDKYPENEYGWLYIEAPEELEEARYFVAQATLILEKTPVLGWFMSVGLLPYIVLFELYRLLVTKRGRELLVWLIPILTMGICLLSPENGNCRYVLPMFYLMPLLIGRVVRDIDKNNNGYIGDAGEERA
ncbi:MAG: hypothetical protein IJ655_05215 [Lachnospiraceae bacterium]|nr:hypothetical protein [Lachnospiraceae bacterium]